MKHLGDICKIDGALIEPVDVVTGGSPCQDLSIAGKRAGLAGARSGLFMEQVRVVKELRENERRMGRTGELVRPRYMVWENVPGAFSSNGGRDFAAVLEEIIRIAEPEAPAVEVPEKGWPAWGGYRDCVGGRWSVAWRVHDAQYWGVPQRRRRIALVADFGGDTAGEILFERRSVPGHPAESGAAGEGPAGEAEGGAACAVRIRGGCDGGGKGALVQREKSGTLGCGNDQVVFCLQGNGIDRSDTAGCGGRGWRTDQCYTLNTVDRPAVCAAAFKAGQGAKAHGIGYAEECAPTLGAVSSGTNQAPACLQYVSTEVSPALRAKANDPYRADMAAYVASVDCRDFTEGGGQSLNPNNVIRIQMIVRRLTPMECERLQGYPDGWTDIGEWRDSKGKLRRDADSPRYKACGNSIALPFWAFLAKRISAQYLRPVTLGSLFDGIGGFPLVFERCNGKGTARWASEIEEFPIAVTKLRFSEEDNEK